MTRPASYARHGRRQRPLIRTTYAAVPARRCMLAAKMLVVAAVMLAAGTVIALASFEISQAILSGRHVGLSIGHPGVPRAIVASALLPPVCALVGMGIGTCRSGHPR